MNIIMLRAVAKPENGAKMAVKGAIAQIKDLNLVCVPTISMPVDTNIGLSFKLSVVLTNTHTFFFLSLKESLVTVHKFDKTWSFVGGINAPKRIDCIGSDGVRYILKYVKFSHFISCFDCSYPQLVKGKDDLRQDAGLLTFLKFFQKRVIIEYYYCNSDATSFCNCQLITA